MKILCAAFFMLCSNPLLQAQDYSDYSYTDFKISQIPRSKTFSTDSIAQYVSLNFSGEIERVRAVYTWITSNIRYSKDSMYYKGWGTDRELKMTDILRRRKGVCENYSELFSNIISKCGIKTFVVSGYSIIGGSVNYTPHAWCAVQVENEWLLCDPTWDEGFKITPHYFLVAPAQFIYNHMPYDPIWQLLEHPISHREFRHGSAHSKKDSSLFHYKDSVQAFFLADTVQQLEAASRRVKQSGYEIESIQTWYSYNQMKLSIIYQEEDMTNYNAAVADRNQATKLFNELAAYSNNRQKPARSEAAINAVFISIDSLIAAAQMKTGLIGRKMENFQYNTEGLSESLIKLAAKVKIQRDILMHSNVEKPAGTMKPIH